MHLYEKNETPGGLLRFGIPDFKMEKHLIDRRMEQMIAEGVDLHCGSTYRRGYERGDLEANHDAVLLVGGAESPATCR